MKNYCVKLNFNSTFWPIPPPYHQFSKSTQYINYTPIFDTQSTPRIWWTLFHQGLTWKKYSYIKAFRKKIIFTVARFFLRQFYLMEIGQLLSEIIKIECITEFIVCYEKRWDYTLEKCQHFDVVFWGKCFTKGTIYLSSRIYVDLYTNCMSFFDFTEHKKQQTGFHSWKKFWLQNQLTLAFCTGF